MNTNSTSNPADLAPNSNGRSKIRGRLDIELLTLCVAAFLLALVVTWTVFEAMPHLEDEHAYLFQAKVFASGRITAEEPYPRGSYAVPFVLSIEGRRFAKYTPGYPLVLALGVLFGCHWLINPLAAAAGIAGTYLLGRDLFDRDTGLLAAALGTLSPMFVMLSGSLLSHTTTLTALTFFAWAFVRLRRPDEPRRLAFALLAGATLGWAAIARPWTAAAVAAPFGLLVLIDVIRNWKKRWRPYLIMALGCALIVAFLPLYNWVATGSPTTNTYSLLWPYDTVGFGPEHGRGEEGHTWEEAITGAKLDLADLSVALLGWPMIAGLPVALVPMAYALIAAPRTGRDWGLAIPMASLVIAYLAYWPNSHSIYGPRYYSEGMTFLWILAARGLVKFGSARWSQLTVKIALPVLIALGIIVVLTPRLDAGYGRYDISRRDANIIRAADLDNTVVLVESGYWTDYANLSWLNSPALDGDVVFAQDRGNPNNDLVIGSYPSRSIYCYDRYQAQPLTRCE